MDRRPQGLTEFVVSRKALGRHAASLGAQAAYDELVPQFEALFERLGRDWPAFYDAVKRIADLPAAERRRALMQAGT